MVEKSDMASSIPAWFSQMYEPMRRVGERVAEFCSPSSEAATTAEYYEISVELPGVSEDDIRVEVHDGRLSVTGEKRSETHTEGHSYFFSERTYGKFQRAFQLPADADQSKISASHKNGVLSIRVAKMASQETGAKSIPVNRG